jgi:hypothetical protein
MHTLHTSYIFVFDLVSVRSNVSRTVAQSPDLQKENINHREFVLDLRTAARIGWLIMVLRRCTTEIQQQARIRLIGVLVRRSFAAEDSDLRRVVSTMISHARKEKAYLNNTPRSKRLLMLYYHPSQRRTNLRIQQRLSLSFVHAKLCTRPQRVVGFAPVLVHQSLQHDRPGVGVLDVERQHVIEPRDFFLSTAAEFGVLKEHDIRVLG